MALLGAALRVGGGALAKNIMGRKKKVKPSTIAPKKVMNQETPKKGGGLVKRPTSKTALAKPMKPLQMVSSSAVSKDDPLKVIHVKVLEIESILKGTLAAEKDEQKRKKQELQDQRRAQQEEGLEKDPKKKPDKKPKMPLKMPKVGLFGFIKNFIGGFIMNYFVGFLIDNAKTVGNILKVVVSVTDFLANAGLQIFNALSTFVDWGYKAIDATRGFIKTIGGEGLAQNFDKVTNLVGTALFLATTIAGSMAVEALTGGGGSDDGGLLDFVRKKGAKKVAGKLAAKGAVKGVAGTAAKGAGVGLGAATAIVTGVGLLSSALGEGAFQLRKFGKGLEEGAKKNYEEKWWTDPRKPVDWLLYQGARFVNFSLNGIGVLLDIVGAPFRYAVELINFGIMAVLGDTEGMKRQRKNLSKFDARVREGIRELLNVATLGFGFKEKGSFGNLFGDEAATKEMVKKMQEGGGVTSDRKPVTRTIEKTKKKPKKFFLRKPTKRTVGNPPKGSNGGSDKAWWDFLGWAGTGSEKTKMGAGGKQLITKISDVDDEFSKNDYFGPIISATSKIILGDPLDSNDFNNVGRGINLLINEGLRDERIAKGMIGYQSGGVVDTPPPFLDVESWVQDSFKKASNKISETKFTSTGTTGPQGQGEYDSATGEFMGSGTSPGTASGAIAASDLYKKIGANAEQWDIYRNSVALIESGGDYSIPGGSGMHYDGRYQMGEAAKKDGSRYAGVEYPGHSDDPNAQVRAAYRANKELQEIIFTGFTLANHTYLMRNETYKNSSIERKLQILGYAHNQGMGGAEKWITTGVVGKDGFGTKGTKYTDLIAANFRAKKSGEELELADNAINVPDIQPQPGEDQEPVEQGEGSEAAQRLLKDFPQITTRAHDGQIFASGLGFWLKKNFIPPASDSHRAGRGDLGDPPQSGADMEHADHGGVKASHRGAGHDLKVALDLGANSADSSSHRGDQKYLWPYISRFLTQYGLNQNPFVPQVLHGTGERFSPAGPGSGEDRGHRDHFHVEFQRKHRGDNYLRANERMFIGQEGESVLPKSASDLLRKNSPGLIAKLGDVSSSAGLQKVLQSAAGVSGYASYEQGAPQTILIDDSSEDMDTMNQEESPMPSFAMPSGSNSYDNSFDFLDYQG